MRSLDSLARWIDENSSRAAFAKAVECSESHLSNILSGRKEPSLQLARRISAHTKGAFSMDDIVGAAA